jgi:iron(III) transport system permease protein
VASVFVYGVVRAMTTLSPVIFLVTAETELATTFIISRVGQGDYGVAFAYTTVFVALLAVFMAVANGWAASRRLGRHVRASRYLRAPA